MSLTDTNNSGDGALSDLIQTNIQMPDSGTSVAISGQVKKVGYSAVMVTGSPLAFPTPPASGIINVIIQVDYTSGAATVKQNTTPGTFPTVDANNIQVFQTVLQPTTTDLALDSSDVTPDTV